MHIQGQAGGGFDGLAEFVGIVRKQQARHILDADGIRTHGLDFLTNIHPVIHGVGITQGIDQGDLGVAAGFGPVTAALGISNLGTPVKSNDGTSYPLPASVSAGLTWMQDFADIHSVKVSADADYFLVGHLTAALGAQYCYNSLVSARVGYHLGTDQSVLPSFLTLGLGVQFAGFALDVSYLTANEQLGGTLCAGIRISF